MKLKGEVSFRRGENMDFVWSGEEAPRPTHLSMPETDGTPEPPASASASAASAPPPRPHRPREPRELKRKSLYSNILIAQSTLPGTYLVNITAKDTFPIRILMKDTCVRLCRPTNGGVLRLIRCTYTRKSGVRKITTHFLVTYTVDCSLKTKSGIIRVCCQ